MNRRRFGHQRRGTSLIELLIFLGILAVVIGTALPLLFSATENRLLQQTISVVEQNGTHVMQSITLRMHQAERILSPAMGATGSVLVLQTASGALDPTIIGINSGSIIIIERNTLETVSSEQVAVQDFEVRNTSTSATRQSATVTFRISRTIRLQMPHSYSRVYEMGARLNPADVPVGNACGCAAPSCGANDTYTWQVCSAGTCFSASTSLECP